MKDFLSEYDMSKHEMVKRIYLLDAGWIDP